MSFDSLTIEKMSSSLVESIMLIGPMFDLRPNTLFRNSSHQADLYSHVFGFESVFQENTERSRLWMVRNWWLSIVIAVAYCIFVFVGRKVMDSRPRYECRAPLIAWNIFLALFSILGTIRVMPEFTWMIANKGLAESVCNNSYGYGHITGFWAFMFVMSKLPELIDTAFIVLRKQPLIFLHWYHHATVLVYCWQSYKDFPSTGRWFMTMNYFVHSMMYSYYACKAMRVKVPGIVNQVITTSQILQMVAGCYVNYLAYTTKAAGQRCNITEENIFWSSLMYFSYFVLFAHFFIKTYVFKKPATGSLSPQDKAARPVTTAARSNGKPKPSDFNNNIHASEKVAKKIN
jgi:elongation of very long chain fatty acids protein 6